MQRILANVERLLVLGGFVVLFGVLPHGLEGDDAVRLVDVTQLVHHGHLTNSKYSLAGPLVSAPVLALGRIVETTSWWAARFNVLVVLVGCVCVWALLRDRIEATLLRRALLALLFASFLTNRLRGYGAEIFTGTLFAIGIACIATRRLVTLGWLAIVLGAVNTPALVVALVPFAVYEAIRTRRLRPFAFLVLAGLLVLLEAWVRRGSPFDTGYGNDHGFRTLLPYSGEPGFSYPFLLGIASILFSFGRGLLFFTPGLALGLDRRAREDAAPLKQLLVPMLLIVAGMVGVYAKWWAWYGGLSWGPRFFVFAALPASLLFAARICSTRRAPLTDLFALAVLALSAWVAFNGAVSDDSQLGPCSAHRYALELLCWYEPTHSSLWWPVLHPPALTWRTGVLLAWCVAAFGVLATPLLTRLAEALRAVVPTRVELVRGWRL